VCLWFLGSNKMCPCGPIPPSSRVDFFSALVAAVLITTKGDESPGSSRMGVIGALVIFFPSEAFQDKLHSPCLAQ